MYIAFRPSVYWPVSEMAPGEKMLIFKLSLCVSVLAVDDNCSCISMRLSTHNVEGIRSHNVYCKLTVITVASHRLFDLFHIAVYIPDAGLLSPV